MVGRKASNGTFWTEKEIAYLKENYFTAPTIVEIASTLKRSPSSVRIKAQRMGLKKCEKRPWTKAELNCLEDLWGEVTYNVIAQRLNRTPEAVRVKANHLGYPSFQLSQDGITLVDLARALKVDYKKVRRWTNPPCKSRLFSFRIKISDKQTKKLINLDTFWKWAEKNKGFIDFSRLEKNSLGAEPYWVTNQRKQDSCDRQKQIRHSFWTKSEESQLEQLVNEFKYTYSEITEIMNRSEKVIAQKLSDLNIKARPLKAEPQPWTPNETATLIEMLNQGIDKELIAQRLGRSETAIMGKQRNIKRKRIVEESVH